MAYSWQFRIMEYSGLCVSKQKHPAEARYVVRQEIGKYLSSFLSLTDALAYDFVPEDVKHAIQTVMSCHKFVSKDEL